MPSTTVQPVSTYRRTSSRAGQVLVVLENPDVQFEVFAASPYLSPEILKPLWHLVDRPSGPSLPFADELNLSPAGNGISIRNLFALGKVEPPRLRLRLHNPHEKADKVRIILQTSDRTIPAWAKWRLSDFQFDEYEGGDWATGQEGPSQSGEFVVRIPPGITREVTLFVDMASVHGDDLGLHRLGLTVESADAKADVYSHAVSVELRSPSADFLDLLPSIYRESVKGDPSAALPDRNSGFVAEHSPFFERYLRSFQDIWDPFQALIGQLDQVFGAYSTPPAYLVWLAGWVFAPFEDDWSEMKRRQLVAEAVELFRWRGTRKGLSRYLQLYTGVEPMIEDRPIQGMTLSSSSLLGDELLLGNIPAHVFVVTIEVPKNSQVRESVIRRIIEFEKPAHTSYSLNLIRP